ncbi:MAG: segregation and condensation protein segregation and condensation protein [Candidatus Parcubacteria bacterium]|jgi:segregation and condensation protein B
MLKTKIESLLFIAAKPLTLKRVGEICDASKEEVAAAVEKIAEAYNNADHGIRLLRTGNEVQLSTSPDHAKMVQEYLKDETTGELTKPSLETLTIVAYRGPVTKAELEQIRGVNCSLILRNLLMRGLVEVQGEPHDPSAVFSVTMDFLRFLGVSAVEELPDYDKLRSHENVVRVLEMAAKEKTAEEGAAEAAAEDVIASADAEKTTDEVVADAAVAAAEGFIKDHLDAAKAEGDAPEEPAKDDAAE